jgi:hypothetical protein
MRNILGEDDDGRLLLRCIRAYTELDVFASFDVHTDVTIKQARAAATKFSKRVGVSWLVSTCLRNVAITNALKFPGIHRPVELSQNAFNPTSLRRYRGEGCHS